MATVPSRTVHGRHRFASAASDGESPARLVRFRRPFRLDTAAVTRGQFAQFVRAGYRTPTTPRRPASPSSRTSWSTPRRSAIRSSCGRVVANAPWWLPVRGATWRRPAGPGESKVAAGVVWWTPDSVIPLSTSAGETPTPTAAGREAAAHRGRMGGGLSGRPVRPPVPWGNGARPRPAGAARMNIWQGEFPRLNTADDGYVDAYGPQNSFGLYNMVGNVWEWTASRWDRNSAPNELPQRPAASDEMTKKGGSFMCHKSYCYRYRCADKVAEHGRYFPALILASAAPSIDGDKDAPKETVPMHRLFALRGTVGDHPPLFCINRRLNLLRLANRCGLATLIADNLRSR
uniref:FGE-sulfatase domain-containing protein n=1 Tax=Macrostomum lignano TaxID=282301 RepID=A0A1I8JP30_9PLAT